MQLMLSKKDIIAINQEFHTGRLMNESSLDYAIGTTKRSKNWLKTVSIIARTILIDHVFEDGNKRTAAAVIMVYCDINGLNFNPDKINEAVVLIIKKNITNLRTIERIIKNVIE